MEKKAKVNIKKRYAFQKLGIPLGQNEQAFTQLSLGQGFDPGRHPLHYTGQDSNLSETAVSVVEDEVSQLQGFMGSRQQVRASRPTKWEAPLFQSISQYDFQKPFTERPGYTKEDAINDRKDLWKPEFDLYDKKSSTAIAISSNSYAPITLEQAKAMACKPFQNPQVMKKVTQVVPPPQTTEPDLQTDPRIPQPPPYAQTSHYSSSYHGSSTGYRGSNYREGYHSSYQRGRGYQGSNYDSRFQPPPGPPPLTSAQPITAPVEGAPRPPYDKSGERPPYYKDRYQGGPPSYGAPSSYYSDRRGASGAPPYHRDYRPSNYHHEGGYHKPYYGSERPWEKDKYSRDLPPKADAALSQDTKESEALKVIPKPVQKPEDRSLLSEPLSEPKKDVESFAQPSEVKKVEIPERPVRKSRSRSPNNDKLRRQKSSSSKGKDYSRSSSSDRYRHRPKHHNRRRSYSSNSSNSSYKSSKKSKEQSAKKQSLEKKPDQATVEAKEDGASKKEEPSEPSKKYEGNVRKTDDSKRPYETSSRPYHKDSYPSSKPRWGEESSSSRDPAYSKKPYTPYREYASNTDSRRPPISDSRYGGSHYSKGGPPYQKYESSSRHPDSSYQSDRRPYDSYKRPYIDERDRPTRKAEDEEIKEPIKVVLPVPAEEPKPVLEGTSLTTLSMSSPNPSAPKSLDKPAPVTDHQREFLAESRKPLPYKKYDHSKPEFKGPHPIFTKDRDDLPSRRPPSTTHGGSSQDRKPMYSAASREDLDSATYPYKRSNYNPRDDHKRRHDDRDDPRSRYAALAHFPKKPYDSRGPPSSYPVRRSRSRGRDERRYRGASSEKKRDPAPTGKEEGEISKRHVTKSPPIQRLE